MRTSSVLQRRARCLRYMLAAAFFHLVVGGCLTPQGPPPAATVGAPHPPVPEPAPVSPPPSPVARPAIDPPPAPPAFMPNDALKDIHFTSGGIDVVKRDLPLLNAAASWLVAHAGWLIVIEGHTDDRGTWGQNLGISERRARYVMSALVVKGVEVTRITAVGVGADRPICLDRTEACRAQNRRVHFLVRPR
jgi:outer membrane protein OmpA-like peptidoglycan-associated protein